MRQTFDLPPVKEGHAYRLILGWRRLRPVRRGLRHLRQREACSPRWPGVSSATPGIRGAYVYDDILPEFGGGEGDHRGHQLPALHALPDHKTTYFGPHPDYYGKPVPPNGHVSLWMEEAKLSPATLNAAVASEG